VTYLYAGHRAAGLDGRSNSGESGALLVIPQTQAGRGYAAFRGNTGGFNDDQAGTPSGQAGVVDAMPIVRQTVDRAVLAHGRDGDAIAQRDVFEFEAGKQRGHAHELPERLLHVSPACR